MDYNEIAVAMELGIKTMHTQITPREWITSWSSLMTSKSLWQISVNTQ